MTKSKPKRFCVFCGETPNSKTREHVVPYWLLELTGDPKRVVTLGFDYTKDKAPISYAWQSYVAPACDECNNTFAELEGRIKPTIHALEKRGALTVGQYDELLDWLDKVRIGVWLVRGMIEKNPIAVDLPHPKEMKLLQGGDDHGMLSLQGYGYAPDVSFPITDLALPKPVVWLYQPVKHPTDASDFKGGYFGHTNLFDTRIMSRTLGGCEGAKGAIFRQWADRIEVLNDPKSVIEFDEVVGDDSKTAGEIVASVYDAQVFLFESICVEWIHPAKPTDFDELLRATRIESNREFADMYRAQGSKIPNS